MYYVGGGCAEQAWSWASGLGRGEFAVVVGSHSPGPRGRGGVVRDEQAATDWSCDEGRLGGEGAAASVGRRG